MLLETSNRPTSSKASPRVVTQKVSSSVPLGQTLREHPVGFEYAEHNTGNAYLQHVGTRFIPSHQCWWLLRHPWPTLPVHAIIAIMMKCSMCVLDPSYTANDT